ncbi:MAG: hypothetical protein UV08_C0011G0014 [Parcubacteria group bacterium GW2011_GWA2_42_18]|nr:MAG: hypothetical protein UV08_C0011G0014 [Parcubacteria group bacterium GW2011_GWA2_42_18]
MDYFLNAMIKKNSLFYMANLSPEIGRMFRAHDSGKKEIADQARNRALKVVDSVLTSNEIKPAGREEWSATRNLIAGYDLLDAFARKILESFGRPFSIKFMNQFG